MLRLVSCTFLNSSEVKLALSESLAETLLSAYCIGCFKDVMRKVLFAKLNSSRFN